MNINYAFKKWFFIVVLLILIIIFIAVIIGIRIGDSYYDDLSFSNVTLQNETFRTTVHQLSSGKSFRRYKYKIEGENLYLTINSGLVTKSFGSGILEIEINDNDLKEVKKVYVKDGKKEKTICCK